MSGRPTRRGQLSPASKSLFVRDITHAQIAEAAGKSQAAIGFALEGYVRMDPRILAALLELTGDASVVADVQRLSRGSWIEQHPDADPDTHLLGSNRQEAS